METQRTTLAIDADILHQAKQLARKNRQPLGHVVSDLMRKSLRPSPERRFRNGIELVPVFNPDAVITLEHVNELRDEMP